MNKVIIFGNGSTARMAAALLGDRMGGVVGSDTTAMLGRFPVQHQDRLIELFPPTDYKLLIAIGYQHGGMNLKRMELFNTLEEAGYQFVRVYPQRPGDFVVDDGSLILPNVTFHDNSTVGRNCFISSNTVIGHDAVIGDHSWINANVSVDGGARIGERCVIGAGAVIGAGVKLGERTLVGPGAVILRDTEPDSVWLAPEAEKHRFSSAVFGRMRS